VTLASLMRAVGLRFLVAIAFTGACSSSADSRTVPAPVEVGRSAPAYRTTSLAGDSVSLAQLHGKVVLLNVWATWCHPCREEIPQLQALHAQYKDRGLELVGVSVDVDGADSDIQEFMKEFAMTYPIWRDPGERVSAQFLVVGVPTTFLIDREGILRWRKTGPIQPGDTALIGALQTALR
jgi:cytochrome c biogenesis protein CcmG, thiol:disulfide interchange protein DsbE